MLPFPPGSKSPPPAGFTGYDGQWPTDTQIGEWVNLGPRDSNLGLRLEHGVIGVDVDAYDTKTGDRTLDEAERRWGSLPATYRSSARADDQVSGIRLYRVPVGVLFKGVIRFDDLAIGDIEIVQPHHRFVITWPSIHPKVGQPYRWYKPDGQLMAETIVPSVEDLPELPPRWVDALSRDAVRETVFDGSTPNRTRAARDQIDEQRYEQLLRLQGDKPPDRLVAERLDVAISALTSGAGSRYDTTRDHVASLMRFHAMGRAGVPTALGQLRSGYVLEVADTRPRGVAEAEFQRLVEGAAALIAATPQVPIVDGRPGCSETGDEPPRDAPSWSPRDLTSALSGERYCLMPTLFSREDGQCLLYPGMTHSFHGESESGKSLIIQAECVRQITQGFDVLYIDFESDEVSVTERLIQLGAESRAVVDHFHYLRPEAKPNASPLEAQAWEETLSTSYVLAVIDGVTDALSTFGRSSLDNDELASWHREMPRRIADRTGAATVVIDHVVKDLTRQGRFAIGGQAKMAGLTGAAYIVEVGEPLGQGLRGVVTVRIGKDRPGRIRPHCGPHRKKDRTQEAARIVVDSTSNPMVVTVGKFEAVPGDNALSFRPSGLMGRISVVFEMSTEPMTKTQAVDQTGGKRAWAMQAFDLLVAEGYLAEADKRRGRPTYRSTRAYRETNDPLSDQYSNSGTDQYSGGSPGVVLGPGS
ncbi:hypothetical protein A5710_20750 [Mycolicibacter sinensis]|uniref:DNA primase/polymerase bifunctional N-terminal domain-containing protein n=1 Tax=Mycolicibacter sinensis (strain JDM601) TaxID=875328 RepID=A0A1A2XY64_MYCSD|nr:hypothetical protein A5710_20750 [Mycolicibacter sinensis]